MIILLSCLAVYASGCIVAMMFFLTGRWPSLLERDVRWPVVLVWPLLVFWPITALTRLFRRGNRVSALP